MLLKSVLSALAGTIALSSGAALAQEYPSKPIRVIVANAAGGATDAAARLYQEALADIVPEPIVVVNMPGAGTTRGGREVLNATPDGHTMLINHQAVFTSAVMGLADYRPEDFEAVAMTGLEPTVVVVRPDSGIENLDDLYAAAAEEGIDAGVQIGALNHFAMAMVANAGDAEFNFVQTGGGGPTYAALLGGHIDAAYATVPDAAQYVEAGEMRAIALLGEDRSDTLPDVPTSIEQGYDVTLPIRHVWYMPKGSPEEAIAYMADALGQAMQTDTVQEFYSERSVEPVIVTGEELDQQIAEEFARFEEIEAGME